MWSTIVRCTIVSLGSSLCRLSLISSSSVYIFYWLMLAFSHVEVRISALEDDMLT